MSLHQLFKGDTTYVKPITVDAWNELTDGGGPDSIVATGLTLQAPIANPTTKYIFPNPSAISENTIVEDFLGVESNVLADGVRTITLNWLRQPSYLFGDAVTGTAWPNATTTAGVAVPDIIFPFNFVLTGSDPLQNIGWDKGSLDCEINTSVPPALPSPYPTPPAVYNLNGGGLITMFNPSSKRAVFRVQIYPAISFTGNATDSADDEISFLPFINTVSNTDLTPTCARLTVGSYTYTKGADFATTTTGDNSLYIDDLFRVEAGATGAVWYKCITVLQGTSVEGFGFADNALIIIDQLS